MQKHSASVKCGGKKKHTCICGRQTQTTRFFFLSLFPPPPHLYLKVSIHAVPIGLGFVTEFLLLSTQTRPTWSSWLPHLKARPQALSSEKCLLHLLALSASSLLLLYIQLHTADSVLCNKYTHSTLLCCCWQLFDETFYLLPLQRCSGQLNNFFFQRTFLGVRIFNLP